MFRLISFNYCTGIPLLFTDRYLTDSTSGDVDPLLDAHYLYQIIEYCKKYPDMCNELRLAKIMFKVEGETELNNLKDSISKHRRTKRSNITGLMFLLNRKIVRVPTDNSDEGRVEIPDIKDM